MVTSRARAMVFCTPALTLPDYVTFCMRRFENYLSSETSFNVWLLKAHENRMHIARSEWNEAECATWFLGFSLVFHPCSCETDLIDFHGTYKHITYKSSRFWRDQWASATINFTYHNFRIRPFDSRTAINNDIVANSFWSPRISYSSRMACVFCPSPIHSGQMWSATIHSTRPSSAMRTQRKVLLAPNRPNIPMAHWLAAIQRKWCRESNRICEKKKKHTYWVGAIVSWDVITYLFWDMTIWSSSRSLISICFNKCSCFSLRLRMWANTWAWRKSFSL